MFNKKIFILIIFAVLVLSSLLVLKNTPYKISAIPSPTPTPPSIYLNESKTKYYNPTDKFIGNLKYQDVVSEADDSLTPISCSEVYRYPSVTSAPPTISSYINSFSDKYPEREILSLRSCASKEYTIALFQLGPCGGGCYGRPSVGIIKNSSVEKAIDIPNEIHTPYYGCQIQPLFLTKDGNFYIECTDAGSSAIYKLDLNTFTLTSIKRCANEADKSYSGYSSNYSCE